MICPKCHTVNDDEEKYCKNCGFQLNSARICPECGKTNDSNSKYCKECGTVLTPVNTFRKQIIDENTKKSFFSMYKVPIICALVIILAVGAVTGMAYYNSNSGGDDESNSIIPLDNNYTGFFEDTIVENDTNKTNETLNKTNDTNTSKNLTEKVENKTTKANQTDKVNKTNKTKTLNDTVNKTKPSNNSSKSINGSSSKDNSSKSISEKVDNKEKSDKNSQDNKNKMSTPDENDSGSSIIIPGISDDENDSQSDSIIDELINDSDSLNDSDTENDTTEEDILNSSEMTEIEMTDVPNLAMEVSNRNYAFSTIEYNGYEFSKAQCIDIFSQYLLNIDKGNSSPIKIKDVKDASNPLGEDLSQSIEKKDYLSIAKRVHSSIDSKDKVPDSVGISTDGAEDLSEKKMLKLFTLAVLNYSVTGELPESVEI